MIAQIGHELDERARVRRERRRAVRAEDAVILAGLGLHPGETAIVELHPIGRVRERRVLPRPEPQKHDALVVRARLIEQGLQEGEVEPPLLRLDLLPRDRHLDGVGADPVEHRPRCRERGGIVGRVVDLRAEHEERRAIDDQRVPAVAAFDPRQLRRRLGQCRRAEQAARRQQARDLPRCPFLSHVAHRDLSCLRKDAFGRLAAFRRQPRVQA